MSDAWASVEPLESRSHRLNRTEHFEMSGVSFALNKGKRKRAIMKEAKEALKLEKHEANTEQVTHGTREESCNRPARCAFLCTFVAQETDIIPDTANAVLWGWKV